MRDRSNGVKRLLTRGVPEGPLAQPVPMRQTPTGQGKYHHPGRRCSAETASVIVDVDWRTITDQQLCHQCVDGPPNSHLKWYLLIAWRAATARGRIEEARNRDIHGWALIAELEATEQRLHLYKDHTVVTQYPQMRTYYHGVLQELHELIQQRRTHEETHGGPDTLIRSCAMDLSGIDGDGDADHTPHGDRDYATLLRQNANAPTRYVPIPPRHRTLGSARGGTTRGEIVLSQLDRALPPPPGQPPQILTAPEVVATWLTQFTLYGKRTDDVDRAITREHDIPPVHPDDTEETLRVALHLWQPNPREGQTLRTFTDALHTARTITTPRVT